MSQTADQMELREEDIAKHLDAALDMLDGFDHSPRIGVAREGGAVVLVFGAAFDQLRRV